MKVKPNVKCVYYAYPTSSVAKEQGFKNGCWYLYVGNEHSADNGPTSIVFASEYKREVVKRADDYLVPWGTYSMHVEDKKK